MYCIGQVNSAQWKAREELNVVEMSVHTTNRTYCSSYQALVYSVGA